MVYPPSTAYWGAVSSVKERLTSHRGGTHSTLRFANQEHRVIANGGEIEGVELVEWTDVIRLGGLAGLVLVLLTTALFLAYRSGRRAPRDSPPPEAGSNERQAIAELHRRILASLPDFFLLVDMEGRLLKVNRKLADAVQSTPASLVESSLSNLMPELDGTVLTRATQGPIHNHRSRLRVPKGPPLQVRWNLSPLLGNPG